MIIGVHVSSVVFLDLQTVAGALARLGERFPGVDGAGHGVSLGDTTWVVRIGAVRPARHALFCGLHVVSIEQPYRPELKGVLEFQEVRGQPRIKVTFEGTCARHFASLADEVPTDKVLHVANDHMRRILDLIVKAIEGLAQAELEMHPLVGEPTGRRRS